MIVGIFIGNDKLELFADENIEIVSSITDSSDITKNTTDYSKGFTVPASDRNNAIFKHYYNADVDNTFDARVKIDGRIELDGLPFKSGKIRLDKVNVKKQKASSYSINFFGKLVNLKDKLKDDELNSLDLSDLNFDLIRQNMVNGLKPLGIFFDSKIIVNLLSKKRLYYNTDPVDTTNTETTVNIANVALDPLELRPSIKLIEIVKAIEVKYGFVFSRDFFGRSEFDNLYLWLNNNSAIQGTPTEKLINWTEGNATDFGLNLTTDIWSNNTFFSSLSNKQSFRYKVAITTSNPEPYKVVVKNYGVKVAELDSSGGNFESEWVEIKTLNSTPVDFEYTFYVASTTSMTYTASISIFKMIPLVQVGKFANASSASLISIFQVSANLPKMKIIDFLKSIFQLFKLVIIQNDDVNIYINTQVDYYSQGKLWDVSRYIDYESNDVNRGDILNEIDFSFIEPTTLLNSQFKLNTRIAYGDEYLKLTDENGDLLDGNKLEVKPQFEQMIYERLRDVETGELTNIMYGLSADATLQPQNPKGHIFYNNKENITEIPFKIIKNDALEIESFLGFLNIPSHTLGFVAPQYATIFSEEFNEWDGTLISNNLYSNYYKDFIDSIFNIKRRNYNYSSILPLNILLALRLNDVLKIKENYYRIDKFTANITNNKVQLNLINSFDNTINPFATDGTIFFARGSSQTIFVRGNDAFTVTLVGSPTWASYTISGRVINIELDNNDTGLDREVSVEIESGSNTITVEVIQLAGQVRADNNVITADSNLITADNG